MANRLAGITIDCADPARLASFWSALLDVAVTGEHGDDADGPPSGHAWIPGRG